MHTHVHAHTYTHTHLRTLCKDCTLASTPTKFHRKDTHTAPLRERKKEGNTLKRKETLHPKCTWQHHTLSNSRERKIKINKIKITSTRKHPMRTSIRAHVIEIPPLGAHAIQRRPKRELEIRRVPLQHLLRLLHLVHRPRTPPPSRGGPVGAGTRIRLRQDDATVEQITLFPLPVPGTGTSVSGTGRGQGQGEEGVGFLVGTPLSVPLASPPAITHIHICVHMYHTHTFTCIYITHACMHASLHAYTHIHTCTYISHTYIYITHACMHAYTHTYLPLGARPSAMIPTTSASSAPPRDPPSPTAPPSPGVCSTRSLTSDLALFAHVFVHVFCCAYMHQFTHTC